MTDEYSTKHPHDEEPMLDGEGRCLVCSRLYLNGALDRLAVESGRLRGLLWRVADAAVVGTGPRFYAVALPSDLWHDVMDAVGYDEMGQ